MGLENKWQFQKDLDTFCNEDIPKEYKRRVIEIIVFLFVSVRTKTPWLTGHAFANWRVSMSENPPTDELGVRDEPNRTTTAKAASIEFIRWQLRSYGYGTLDRNNPSGTPPGPIWVFNNVRYMQALADGHSQQAPKGYIIDNSIEETLEYIASIREW